MKLTRRIAIAALAGVAVVGIAAGTAVAATASSAPPPARVGCVADGTRALVDVYENVPANFTCPAGDFPVSLGGGGAAGPQGAAGATGATGPSGVVSVTTDDLGAVASVPTGGGFVANATLAGTVTLKAGTYEISVSAKATPTLTGDVQVYPQFFVYDQAASSSFAGDLLAVGAGALESGGNTQIDSYYSGTGIITLSADTTLRIYSFGYDSDRGAGSYALDDLTVSAVRLTPAS